MADELEAFLSEVQELEREQERASAGAEDPPGAAPAPRPAAGPGPRPGPPPAERPGVGVGAVSARPATYAQGPATVAAGPGPRPRPYPAAGGYHPAGPPAVGPGLPPGPPGGVDPALHHQMVLDQQRQRAAQQQQQEYVRAQQQKAKASGKAFKRRCGGQTWVDPTLAEWPENDFRIFVGNLGAEASDGLLAKVFGKYASFQKAKVVRDMKSKKSKGFGFVSFGDSADMARALREVHGKYIGNRPCKLKKSNWEERNTKNQNLEGGAQGPVKNRRNKQVQIRSGRHYI